MVESKTPHIEVTSIVAIGPLCWGSADITNSVDAAKAREKAIKNCKRECPSAMTIKPGKHIIKVYEVVGFSGITGSGGIMMLNGGSTKELPESFLIVRKR